MADSPSQNTSKTSPKSSSRLPFRPPSKALFSVPPVLSTKKFSKVLPPGDIAETIAPKTSPIPPKLDTKILFLMDQYQDQQELIVFADTKIGGLLLLDGAILLFLLSKITVLRLLLTSVEVSSYSVLVVALALCIIGLVGVSIYYGFSALIPRYISCENKVKAPLMIFFSSILQNYENVENYSTKLEELTPNDVIRDLSHQIVEVSGILGVKYSFIRLAALFVAASFPFVALFYGFLFELSR